MRHCCAVENGVFVRLGERSNGVCFLSDNGSWTPKGRSNYEFADQGVRTCESTAVSKAKSKSMVIENVGCAASPERSGLAKKSEKTGNLQGKFDEHERIPPISRGIAAI